MNRRVFLRELSVGGSLVIGLPLGGCIGLGSGDSSENVDGTLVEMTDGDKYEPESITVSVGETVVWRNTGSAPHTVTAYEDDIPSDAAYFASGDFTSESAARNGSSSDNGFLYGDDEYTHTFDVPGPYAYFCLPHEQAGMTGMVTVGDASQSAEGGA